MNKCYVCVQLDLAAAVYRLQESCKHALQTRAACRSGVLRFEVKAPSQQFLHHQGHSSWFLSVSCFAC